MTNQDPTLNIAQERKWFYDHLIDLEKRILSTREQEFRQFERDSKKVHATKKLMRRVPRHLQNHQFFQASEQIAILERDYPIHRANKIGAIKSSRDCLEKMLSSRPILIGPATMDSLINEKPTTYELMKTFKLPFNNLFFELFEPFRMGIPFHEFSGDLRAIGLLARGITSRMDYCTNLQFSSRPDELYVLTLEFNSTFDGKVLGTFNTFKDPAFKNPQIQEIMFALDAGSDRVDYSRLDELKDIFLEKYGLRVPPKEEIFKYLTEAMIDESLREKIYKHQVSKTSLPNVEVFTQIPNLCTNLVNYINSHNTTVVPRTDEIQRRDKAEEGKKREFYVIEIKDRVVQEYEPREDKLWELHERIYVRGHFRTFQHEKYTKEWTWVGPYIKGPKDAPFRDQRHLLLAEKLFREQEMQNLLSNSPIK